ncbi:hypothetical protein HDU96_000399 [Phlyctochytrium bullatum]|nr:hypothetical protein HDU96_000399 [Phlyctochytrium bullatum]
MTSPDAGRDPVDELLERQIREEQRRLQRKAAMDAKFGPGIDTMGLAASKNYLALHGAPIPGIYGLAVLTPVPAPNRSFERAQAKIKPHRCNGHMEDFLIGITSLPLDVVRPFGLFLKCMWSNPGEEPPRLMKEPTEFVKDTSTSHPFFSTPQSKGPSASPPGEESSSKA